MLPLSCSDPFRMNRCLCFSPLSHTILMMLYCIKWYPVQQIHDYSHSDRVASRLELVPGFVWWSPVIIPFPPHQRKARNNRLKSITLEGSFCVGKLDPAMSGGLSPCLSVVCVSQTLWAPHRRRKWASGRVFKCACIAMYYKRMKTVLHLITGCGIEWCLQLWRGLTDEDVPLAGQGPDGLLGGWTMDPSRVAARHTEKSQLPQTDIRTYLTHIQHAFM